LLASPVIAVLQWCWRGAIVLACIGLWSPLAMVVVAALGTYLIGLPNNFGMHHSDAAFVIALWVMALGPAGDAMSVDALRRRTRPDRHAWEYGWPVVFIQTLVALALFSAGVAKLR